ncbi:hypothetical protein CRM22_007403, partial [Opisthorchis felineus]
MELIRAIFEESAKATGSSSGSGTSVQRQLAYLLGRQGVVLPDDENSVDEELTEMLWNTRLSEHFLALGRELDIMEPKV